MIYRNFINDSFNLCHTVCIDNWAILTILFKRHSDLSNFFDLKLFFTSNRVLKSKCIVLTHCIVPTRLFLVSSFPFVFGNGKHLNLSLPVNWICSLTEDISNLSFFIKHNFETMFESALEINFLYFLRVCNASPY